MKIPFNPFRVIGVVALTGVAVGGIITNQNAVTLGAITGIVTLTNGGAKEKS